MAGDQTVCQASVEEVVVIRPVYLCLVNSAAARQAALPWPEAVVTFGTQWPHEGLRGKLSKKNSKAILPAWFWQRFEVEGAFVD